MEILTNLVTNCLCQGLDPPLVGRGQSACLLSKAAVPSGCITSINFSLRRKRSLTQPLLPPTHRLWCVCSIQTDSSCFHWLTCDADLSLGGLDVFLVIYLKAVKSKTATLSRGLCDLWQGISRLLSSVFLFYMWVIILPCKAMATFKFNVSKSIVNSTHVY